MRTLCVLQVYEESDSIYAVLELMEGGDLLDRLLERVRGKNPYTEVSTVAQLAADCVVL